MSKADERPKRPYVTNPCDHCGNPVRVTKPSESGLSFCTKSPACVAARARVNYQRRVENQVNLEAELMLGLVRTLANTPRQQCPGCGLVNALPGYKHPDREGHPCVELGNGKMGSTLGSRLVLAIWPAPDRVYVDGFAS